MTGREPAGGDSACRAGAVRGGSTGMLGNGSGGGRSPSVE
ncbi:hypothetical protein TOK_1993 [Pseudonocardia sp. N23]|nr:hypothetical protein TOK_1993 [Pseudonocardia sp. N23]